MFNRIFNAIFGRVNSELENCEREGAELTRALSELRLKLVTTRERVEFASRQIDETFGALDSCDEAPLSIEAPPVVNGAPKRRSKLKSK